MFTVLRVTSAAQTSIDSALIQYDMGFRPTLHLIFALEKEKEKMGE
jgi:hypothetical protein